MAEKFRVPTPLPRVRTGHLGCQGSHPHLEPSHLKGSVSVLTGTSEILISGHFTDKVTKSQRVDQATGPLKQPLHGIINQRGFVELLEAGHVYKERSREEGSLSTALQVEKKPPTEASPHPLPPLPGRAFQTIFSPLPTPAILCPEPGCQPGFGDSSTEGGVRWLKPSIVEALASSMSLALPSCPPAKLESGWLLMGTLSRQVI